MAEVKFVQGANLETVNVPVPDTEMADGTKEDGEKSAKQHKTAHANDLQSQMLQFISMMMKNESKTAIDAATAIAGNLINWSNQQVSTEIRGSVDELKREVHEQKENLGKNNEIITSLSRGQEECKQGLAELQQQINVMKAQGVSSAASSSTSDTSSVSNESSSNGKQEVQPNIFKQGRPYVLNFSGDMEISLEEAEAQIKHQLTTKHIPHDMVKAIVGDGISRSFILIFHQRACSIPDSEGQLRHIASAEDLAKMLKNSYKVGEKWAQIIFTRSDKKQCEFSFSFEKSRARRIKETLSKAVKKEMETSYPLIKARFAVIKKDGVVTIDKYTKLIEVKFSSAGALVVNQAPPNILSEYGIDPQILDGIVNAKKTPYL